MSITELLALLDGEIYRCEDAVRLDNLARALRGLEQDAQNKARKLRADRGR